MSTRQGALGLGFAAAAGLACLGGCASTSADRQGARLSDNFVLYAPFDNERDWGPSFLVGAPYHHLGDETRIDDTRSIPHIVEGTPGADPDRPPLNSESGQIPPPQEP